MGKLFLVTVLSILLMLGGMVAVYDLSPTPHLCTRSLPVQIPGKPPPPSRPPGPDVWDCSGRPFP